MTARAKGRALWLPDVLRDVGLTVLVEPGWEHAGKEPQEWVAQCNHHTASSARGGVEPARGTVRDGRPDVPPPLANTLPRRDGAIRIMASGAANHPGVAYLPHRGGIASGVKYWCLGHEIELDGVGEPFPPAGRQYEAVSVMNAAIATYLGHDPSRDLWDHKSICRPAGRKIDVHPYDLADGRIRCARRMTGTPIPTPTKDWFDMASEADLEKMFDRKLKPINDALAGVARKAVVLRDPRDGKAWIVDEDGRWHVPSRKLLDVLVYTGQVASYGRAIPVADPSWLDGIPVIDAPEAA